MKPQIQEATTGQQRHDVFRFRYDTYVEEMGRYRSIANHTERTLIEPEDETARLYIATDGEKVVGTMRLNWGGDAPVCERQIEQYSLQPFLAQVPEEQIIVGERFMVAPSQRGTDLIFRLFKAYLNFVNDNRVQLMFGDCEPHLLNLYLGMGFQTYAQNNVNSPETGYLVPLVMVPEDLTYMRKIKSPLIAYLRDFGEATKLPASMDELLPDSGGVLSQTLTSDAGFQSEIENAIRLSASPANLFNGMSVEEQERCLKKSNAITCRAGDHLIRKDNVAQNMFVVLAGHLEVHANGRIINTCSSGDIVGEMAFLLENPRSADVYVATDGTRVLSLSESNLKKLSAEDPALAAKLLLNLSKLLCHKLARNG